MCPRQRELYPIVSLPLQSIVHPLAFADLSSSSTFTNYSRAIALDILSERNQHLKWSGEVEMLIPRDPTLPIPRDPTLPIPEMVLQNTTHINAQLNQSQFYAFQIDLARQSTLGVSFHLQLRPTIINTSYLLLDPSDRWALFCPDHQPLYTYFIDNEQIGDRSSIVLRLRELSSTEMLRYCSPSPSKDFPTFDRASLFRFSSDYFLRTFLSGCYYFTSNHQWRSDGLRVCLALSPFRDSLVFSA